MTTKNTAAMTTLTQGGTVQDAIEYVTPQMVDKDAGSSNSYDSTAAIQGAIDTGRVVYLPYTGFEYKITSQLVVRNNCAKIIGDGQYTTVLRKAFNGDCIVVNTNGAELSHFDIEGDGATYTGGGIKPVGYDVKLSKLRINGTQDSCVIYDPAIGTNASAGTYSVVEDCFLKPYNDSTTYAIRSTGADESTRPTDRKFSKISGGSSLVDFSGMNVARLTYSLGTRVKFDASSAKVTMIGNRITQSVDNLEILGFDHNIDQNNWGLGASNDVILKSTATGVHFGPQNVIVKASSALRSIVDEAAIGSPSLNSVHTNLIEYPFTWFGTTTNPTLGNATKTAYYKRSGSQVHAVIKLIRGSTTTNATGTWSFQLPFEAYVDAVGPAIIKSSTGTFSAGVIRVFGGQSVGYIYVHGTTAAMTDATVTFSTGAEIAAEIDYLISPT